MNSELKHSFKPARLTLFWVFFYLMIIIVIIAGIFVAANQIKTHTLPTGKTELAIPYSKYVVGESISFTIKNGYNSSAYILNDCPSEPLAVYKQVDNLWVRQHDTAIRGACSSEQRQVGVAAGELVSGNFDAWKNLFSQPGKYRIVAFVEYYNALPYQDIDVIASPQVINTVTSTQTDNQSTTTNNTVPQNIVVNDNEDFDD